MLQMVAGGAVAVPDTQYVRARTKGSAVCLILFLVISIYKYVLQAAV